MREETKTFGVAIPPPGFSVSEWSGAGTESLALALVVIFLWFFDVCGRAALDFQLSLWPDSPCHNTSQQHRQDRDGFPKFLTGPAKHATVHGYRLTEQHLINRLHG